MIRWAFSFAYRLVGFTCGSHGHTKRYYRTQRAEWKPQSGTPFGRLIPAEPLEQKVLEYLRAVVCCPRDLRGRLLDAVKRQTKGRDNALKNLTQLERQRTNLEESAASVAMTRDRSGPLVAKALDKKLAEVEQQMRELDAQIAQAKAALSDIIVDPEQHVDAIVERLGRIGGSIEGMSHCSIHRLLSVLVSKAEVDLATKEVTFEFALPEAAVMDPSIEALNMCLVPSSHPSCGLQTHFGPKPKGYFHADFEPFVSLGTFRCVTPSMTGKRGIGPCITCHRLAAA